jgi:hypothetical protein
MIFAVMKNILADAPPIRRPEKPAERVSRLEGPEAAARVVLTRNAAEHIIIANADCERHILFVSLFCAKNNNRLVVVMLESDSYRPPDCDCGLKRTLLLGQRAPLPANRNRN